jgi:hypothetical protein
MRLKTSIIFSLLLCFNLAIAQEIKTKNIVVITFDGYRWKEFFNGADSSNLFGKKFTKQDSAWRVNNIGQIQPMKEELNSCPLFGILLQRMGKFMATEISEI